MQTEWNFKDMSPKCKAKICITQILEFKSLLKFHTDTEEIECDHRKLSDYDLQQFWNYLQRVKNHKCNK